MYVQQNKSYFWGNLIPAGSLILATIVIHVGRQNYILRPPAGSVLATTLRIVKEAIKKSWRPALSSLFVDHWLDRAKQCYGGTYSNWEVEDVKKAYRLLPIFGMFLLYWTVYAQVSVKNIVLPSGKPACHPFSLFYPTLSVSPSLFLTFFPLPCNPLSSTFSFSQLPSLFSTLSLSFYLPSSTNPLFPFFSPSHPVILSPLDLPLQSVFPIPFLQASLQLVSLSFINKGSLVAFTVDVYVHQNDVPTFGAKLFILVHLFWAKVFIFLVARQSYILRPPAGMSCNF